MNISIQCVHCHKRYNAPASMAGKRVKCKHCGKVFAIPSTTSPAEDAPASNPAPAVQSQAAPPPSSPPPGSKLNDPRHGYAKKIDRKSDVQALDVAEEAPVAVMLRPSFPHDFPGAPFLDQYGPWILLVFGLGWLILMSIASAPINAAWVGYVRMGALLALFLLVAFPVTYFALSWAAGKCRFLLPPAAALRTLAVIALPFATPWVFWFSSQTTGMLVFGVIVGMLFAAGGAWLLFRLQPQDYSTTLGAAAVSSAASVAISYGLLALVNLILVSSAKSSGVNQLAVSPLGPTLAWDVPLSDGQPPKKLVAKANPTTTEITTQPVETTQPIISTPVTPTSNPSTAPVIVPVTQPTTTAPVVMTQPAEPATKPSTTAPATLPTQPAVASASPLVAKTIPLPDLNDFTQVLLPTATAGQVAFLKTTSEEDTIEVWSLTPPVKKAQAVFRREKDTVQRYALSPAGDSIARVITWPKLAVAIWSFSAEKDVKTIPLNIDNGTPTLLGFSTADAIVIQWSKNALAGIEVLGIKAANPQRISAFDIDPVDPGAGNSAISSDGHTLAIATASTIAGKTNEGGIDLWDLTSPRKRPLRTLPITMTKWVRPAGVAFSPDSKSVAAFFEQNRQGLLVNFNTVTGQKIHEHLYPTLTATAPADPRAHNFDFLADNTGWLLYSQTLLDLLTGKPLGDLDLPTPKTQKVIDKETLLIQTTPEHTPQWILVKLNPDQLTAKRTTLHTKPKP